MGKTPRQTKARKRTFAAMNRANNVVRLFDAGKITWDQMQIAMGVRLKNLGNYLQTAMTTTATKRKNVKGDKNVRA